MTLRGNDKKLKRESFYIFRCETCENSKFKNSKFKKTQDLKLIFFNFLIYHRIIEQYGIGSQLVKVKITKKKLNKEFQLACSLQVLIKSSLQFTWF